MYERKELPKKLKLILQELSQLDAQKDRSRRIQLYQQAISLLPREQNPELWAKLHFELGINLYRNPKDDQAENIEKAIKHYRQALQVYTRRDFPADWAMVKAT